MMELYSEVLRNDDMTLLMLDDHGCFVDERPSLKNELKDLKGLPPASDFKRGIRGSGAVLHGDRNE
jgi:hypothetical protein